MISTLPHNVNVMNTPTVADDRAQGLAPVEQVSPEAGTSRGSAVHLDILLTWRGRVGLFKKSAHGSTGSTPWQLLSVPRAGHASALDDELLQCIDVLHGGTGLAVRDILTIRCGPMVEVPHGSQSTQHVVYIVETNQRRLALGPEYSVYRWVKKPRIGRFDGGAEWLAPVLEASASTPAKSRELILNTAGRGAILAA